MAKVVKSVDVESTPEALPASQNIAHCLLLTANHTRHCCRNMRSRHGLPNRRLRHHSRTCSNSAWVWVGDVFRIDAHSPVQLKPPAVVLSLPTLQRRRSVYGVAYLAPARWCDDRRTERCPTHQVDGSTKYPVDCSHGSVGRVCLDAVLDAVWKRHCEHRALVSH